MRSLVEAVTELAGTGLDQRQLTLLLEIVSLSAGKSGGIPVDTAAEKRRAYDRERKAAKRNSTGNSTGIPPDSKSATYLTSLNSEIQKKEERKKERARGKKIPPDWRPNSEHIAAGEKLGLTEAQVIEQAEDLRLWAQSNEHRAVARKTNWDMTFLSWLRRNKPKGPVNGAGNPLMAAFDKLIARAEEAEGDGNPPMRDITPTGDQGG